MKIICISDTHNKHDDIEIPDGDIIVHAGDFTEAGTKGETVRFLKWFSALPHFYKILVPGNHDFYIEKHINDLETIIPHNIHLLINSGVNIKNVKFWGSPYTPGDGTWAFNEKLGTNILRHWEKIPGDTDFLITHSPPYGILDELDNKRHIGCEKLTKTISKIALPHHIFGHAHNNYGVVRTQSTIFLNASSLDNRYRPINTPLVVIMRS